MAGNILKRVKESGVLMTNNEIFELGEAKDGGRWFKDRKTGLCYRVIEVGEDGFIVAETRETKKIEKVKREGFKIIKCIVCSAEREIAIQDAFQVVRCKECQRKHRNEKRRARQQITRAEKRRQKELEQVEEGKPCIS